jgi:hypothetical protein
MQINPDLMKALAVARREQSLVESQRQRLITNVRRERKLGGDRMHPPSRTDTVGLTRYARLIRFPHRIAVSTRR